MFNHGRYLNLIIQIMKLYQFKYNNIIIYIYIYIYVNIFIYVCNITILKYSYMAQFIIKFVLYRYTHLCNMFRRGK